MGKLPLLFSFATDLKLHTETTVNCGTQEFLYYSVNSYLPNDFVMK